MVRPHVGRLTAPFLFSALLACSQSLFDENVGDDGPGGGADDGDDDGSTVDDGADGADGVDDGGDDGGDGGAACPSPCQGHPVIDFTLEQGGANGRWFYLADRGEPAGAGYDDLAAGTYQGADAWVVEDDAAPAIVNCAGADAEVCAGAGDSLVFVPAAEGAVAPVLSFVPPGNGSYRLVGNFRLPQGFEEGVQRQVLVSRNARHDTQFAPSFLTKVDPTEFSVDIEALAGDRILVSLPATGAGDGSPIAFDFGVTLLGGDGEIFPGKCQFAATFSSDDPLADRCGGTALNDLNDGDGPPGTTVPGPSLSEGYGDARVFAEGQYMVSDGSPMDYRDDFTIQFWANVATPQPSFDPIMFGDWDSDAAGGTLWILDQMEPLINICYFYGGGPWPTDTPAPCLDGALPRDDAWHFIRVSRKDEAGTMSLCIDGVRQSSLTEQGSADMTSGVAPQLGKNPFAGVSYFGGSIDDVRIFKRALPCEAAP